MKWLPDNSVKQKDTDWYRCHIEDGFGSNIFLHVKVARYCTMDRLAFFVISAMGWIIVKKKKKLHPFWSVHLYVCPQLSFPLIQHQSLCMVSCSCDATARKGYFTHRGFRSLWVWEVHFTFRPDMCSTCSTVFHRVTNGNIHILLVGGEVTLSVVHPTGTESFNSIL